MTDPEEVQRVATATREIAAGSGRIFELIADPAQQPLWDGNDNLAEAAPGQRVRAVGEVFTMTLTMNSVRENHVVEFLEGRRIAWRPAEPGQDPPYEQRARPQPAEPSSLGCAGSAPAPHDRPDPGRRPALRLTDVQRRGASGELLSLGSIAVA